MRVHSLPVLYLPYMVWPTKTDRSSGLLFPKIGNSNRKGVSLGLAYYQVLGRSADTTFYSDLYSKDYFALGNEVRYHPSEGTSGAFRGYVIKDPELDQWRWKVRLDHDSKDLPLGLRGVVSYEDYSDFNFFRDFERGLSTSTRSFVYSNAFLSGNWGNQSMNMLVDRRQNFLGANVITLEQLPELEYHLRDSRVGTLPIYYSVDSSANYFSVDRVSLAGDYGRFHIAPQLRVPLSPTPWLSFTVNGGYDYTYYGDSMGVVNNAQAFTGETLTRGLPFVGAELIGPSLSKIYNWSMGSFGKFKHIIEPRFTYGYESNFDDQARVPVFDELDNVGGFQSGRVALTNRVLGKPGDPTQGDAREIFSLELARRYSFDETRPLEAGTPPGGSLEQSQWGPLELTLRSYPTQGFGLRLDADYSLLFSQITNVQLSGNTTIGRQTFSLTWTPTWRATDGTELNNQTILGTTLHMGQHLTLSSYLTYDFENSLLQNQRHLITWAGGCYAIHLELHEQTTSTQKRRDFLFSIDLKNVGTFLDLNGGETYGL